MNILSWRFVFISGLMALSGCGMAPTLSQVQSFNPAPQGYVWEPAGLGLYKTVPIAPGSVPTIDHAKLSADFKRMETYEFGFNGPPDLVKAAAVLREIVAAGDAGDVLAERKLAIAYQLGAGLPKSDAEALSWWRAAAEHGDPNAESRMMYFYTVGGDGLKPNWERAEFWKQALLHSVPGMAAIIEAPSGVTVKKGS